MKNCFFTAVSVVGVLFGLLGVSFPAAQAATSTTYYSLTKPAVNDPVDQDLWGTELNANLDTIDSTIHTLSLAAQLPVGSLYFNATDNTNPATLLGYGTWTSFGAGRVIMGDGTGTDINGDTLAAAAGDTGGEYNHLLTSNEMPAHTHGAGTLTFSPVIATFATPNSSAITGGTGNAGNFSIGLSGSTASAGGGVKHNVTPPYIVVFIWKRTA